MFVRRFAIRMAALAFSCAILGVLLYIAQIVLNVPTESKRRVQTTQYIEPHHYVGWAHVPSVRAEVQSTVGGKVAYQVTYVIDEFGRRVTPAVSERPASRFLIFLGGSNTFGVGLHISDSLPFLTGLRVEDTQVYNYAVPGYGAGHVLAKIESTDFREQVQQKRGFAVYGFSTFHVDRLVGGLRTIAWAGPLPHYTMENGVIVRKGFIQEDRPIYFRLIKAFQKSFLYTRYKVKWPFQVEDKDLELACLVIHRSKRLLQDQFEELKFLLVLHPHSQGMDLTSCLSRYGIDYLDLRKAFRGKDRDLVNILGDGHVSSYGNSILAEKLGEYLNRAKW